MTRFDAADPTERRKLFADAVRAHRERNSRFLTVELDPAALDEAEGAASTEDRENRTDEDGEPVAPWIQFADRTFNLDCTDAELDRLTDLLDDYPEFRIDSMESPEDADGTNVRISARSDPNRLAAFVDEAFAAVYGAPADYRAWVVQV
ncbi:MAG: hypothetical protein ABEJ61_10025 [Haloferacaceae archaeon]